LFRGVRGAGQQEKPTFNLAQRINSTERAAQFYVDGKRALMACCAQAIVHEILDSVPCGEAVVSFQWRARGCAPRRLPQSHRAAGERVARTSASRLRGTLRQRVRHVPCLENADILVPSSNLLLDTAMSLDD
jgi:hypothetical protein